MKTMILRTGLIILSMLFIISCSDENSNIDETNSIELKKYIDSESFRILSKNHIDFTNGLNFKSFETSVENGLTIYSVNSEDEGLPIGRLYFLINSNNEFKTIIEKYAYDKNKQINSITFSNIFDQDFISLNAKKINKDTYSLKFDKNSFSKLEKRSWWACTRECTGDAWGACAGDNECDFLCAAAGGYLGCTASITTACAGWCAMDSDNDLTP